MATYNSFLSLLNGVARTVNLSANTLEVGALALKGSSSGSDFIQQANASTAAYTIIWPAAQAASSGYALYNDGAGNLTWAPAASGANTALSNLASVAINTSLLPGVDNSINLGSATKSWASANIHTLIDASNVISLDAYNRLLEDTGGIVSVDYANRRLKDSSSAIQLSWSTSGVNLGVDGSVSGILNISNAGASAHVSVSAQNVSSSYNFNLPATAGTSGYALTSAGGGSSAMTWSAFQAPGNYITALTGDVTASGPGSAVATLATVNSNVGSFGSSTSIPSFTVNAKGLITAASGNAIVAPAGTLSGTTLNSSVVASSLTSLGIQGQALNMGSFQINDLAAPSVSSDAATKGYVDAAISGLTWQGPAQAYANSNVPLTGSTPLVIDGYTVANGNLVILGNQTVASQNGEYSVGITGGSYTLTANGLPTVVGDAWLITNGTVYANSAFTATAVVPAAQFIEFAGPTAYSFTAPLQLSGNTVSITQASGSANGYLSSTDWNTFNNKQPAGNYITALTGDATASGPGSSAITLATVNSNVGTFASVTVNAKGLVTAASNLSGDATTSGSAITLATVNGSPGTFAIASVTVNAKGLVTAASAATTTGTGSVVLSASPTLSGTANAANLALSGTLLAPTSLVSAIYGGAATLAANTTYALRWGMPANSETAGKLYAADWNTSSFDLFWVVGLYNSTSTTATGTTISVVSKGVITLGSSDTAFGSSDQGRPVYLGASGAFTPYSTFSPSAGDANMKLGIAQSASVIYVDCQMMGVS